MDFWRLSFQDSQKSISLLLEQESTTLATLLNEHEILQETISGNEALFQFYCRPDIISQLFDYIVDLSLDENLRLKYPFLCTEILTVELTSGNVGMSTTGHPISVHHVQLMVQMNSAIEAALPHVIPKFWHLLHSPAPLPADTLSFFAKVNLMLLMRFPNEMIKLLKSLPNVVESVARHLYSNVIQELVYKLWSLEERSPPPFDYESSQDRRIIRWWNECGWTLALIDRLSPHLEPDEHLLASQVLLNMIALCNEERVPSHALILDMLSPASIDKYWKFLSDTQAPHYASSFIAILDVSMDLIRRSILTRDTPDALAIAALLNSFGKNFGILNAILTDPKYASRRLALSVGTVTPLGVERLKLCEFFAELVQVDTPTLISAFIDYRVPSVLLDLFFYYEWNNFLHAAVVDFVANLFTAASILRKSPMLPIQQGASLASLPLSSETLVYYLFSESKITSRIVHAHKLNEATVEKPRGYRLGYMGHLFLLTDEIMKLATRWTFEKDSGEKEYLQPFLKFELEDPEWLEYEQIFRITALRQSTILGGGPRPIPSSLDSGSDEEGSPTGRSDMLDPSSTLSFDGSFGRRRSTRGLDDVREKEESGSEESEDDDDDDDDDDDRPIFSQRKGPASASTTSTSSSSYQYVDDEDDDEDDDDDEPSSRSSKKAGSRYAKKSSMARKSGATSNSIDTFDYHSNESPELLYYSDQLARFFCQQIANQLPEHFLPPQSADSPEASTSVEASSALSHIDSVIYERFFMATTQSQNRHHAAQKSSPRTSGTDDDVLVVFEGEPQFSAEPGELGAEHGDGDDDDDLMGNDNDMEDDDEEEDDDDDDDNHNHHHQGMGQDDDMDPHADSQGDSEEPNYEGDEEESTEDLVYRDFSELKISHLKKR